MTSERCQRAIELSKIAIDFADDAPIAAVTNLAIAVHELAHELAELGQARELDREPVEA